MAELSQSSPKWVESRHPYLDNIANQLIEYTRLMTGASAVAKESGEEKTERFHSVLANYGSEPDKYAAIERAAVEAATLDPGQKRHAASAMAAERIVLNALGNMYRRMDTPSPEERFTDYFERGLKGKSAQEQEAFIKNLEQARDDMIISVVQTMHPTIYHTKYARDQETALTAVLEKAAEGYREKPKNARNQYQKRVDHLVTDAKKIIKGLVEQVIDGTKVTPGTQVTVSEENSLDRKNHVVMQDAFDAATKGFNRALKNVANQLQISHGLTENLAGRMRASEISDANAVWRTWAYGADADGRDLSTSIVLYDGIHHHVEHGEFIGRKRDLRENAKDQKQAVSCLVQRACRKNGDFRDFCEEFDHSHKEQMPERNGWVNSRKSTVLQLSESEQAEMFRTLITGEYGSHQEKLQNLHLVPQSLKDQTIAFNAMFRKEYAEFLKSTDYSGYLASKGITDDGPLPDLRSLNEEDLQKLAERIGRRAVECGLQRELVHFTLDTGANGNGHSADAKSAQQATKEEKGGSLLYNARTGDNQDFFKPAYKIKEENVEGKKVVKTVKITDKERRKTLDVIKRLHVLDDAIEKYGDKVADRYQIANFESASDFYATLLLFKETGILQVDNGKVAGKPKLSLQPLLETEQDQKHAVELFSKLLDDPLVLSYYQALGNKAEMMVGYSDGAKSAGNLASEWSIHKCGRDLKKLFAEKGIELNIFHGRGRGDSRGGQFDEGQNYRAASHVLHDSMHYDETLQSDGPMNGAISKARGEDTQTSIITGILTAKQEADREAERMKDPAYAKRLQGLEHAIDAMADDASAMYRKLVSENPATGKLLGTMPDNPYKSSRAASRKPGPIDFESARAITVEYGLNAANAPLMYIGMKQAMEKFAASGQQVEDKDGHMVSGKRALEALYQGNAAFRNILDKTELGMRDYDPAVFRQCAKVAGVSSWAEECIKELDGLADLTRSIRRFDATKEALRAPKSDPTRPTPLSGTLAMDEIIRRDRRQQGYEKRAEDPLLKLSEDLSVRARALLLSGAVRDGSIQSAQGESPLIPQDPAEAETMRNLVFVMSDQHRTKGLRTPAAVMAAVDNVPFLARVRESREPAAGAVERL